MPRPLWVLWVFCLLAGCAVAETRRPLSLIELRKKGAVLQRHEYSCGAAALATLMNRFGEDQKELGVLKQIFPEELPKFRDPKTGKMILRALTLEDLERGARKNGFKVVSVQLKHRRDFEGVLLALQPVIARMSLYESYHHFVVIHRLENDWVWISDPAYGHMKMPKSQLFEAWEKGDRVLLAVSKLPFEAWKTREDRIFLRRSDSERKKAKNPLGPMPIYKSIHQRMSRLSTFQ